MDRKKKKAFVGIIILVLFLAGLGMLFLKIRSRDTKGVLLLPETWPL